MQPIHIWMCGQPARGDHFGFRICVCVCEKRYPCKSINNSFQPEPRIRTETYRSNQKIVCVFNYHLLLFFLNSFVVFINKIYFSVLLISRQFENMDQASAQLNECINIFERKTPSICLFIQMFSSFPKLRGFFWFWFGLVSILLAQSAAAFVQMEWTNMQGNSLVCPFFPPKNKIPFHMQIDFNCSPCGCFVCAAQHSVIFLFIVSWKHYPWSNKRIFVCLVFFFVSKRAWDRCVTEW